MIVMPLPDFLLARIAEDEALASEAALSVGSRNWLVGYAPHEGTWICKSDATSMPSEYGQDAEEKHAERHDPARVLAECEAKRRIVVELHTLTAPVRRPVTDAKVYVCTACEWDSDDMPPEGVDEWPCDTLRALAAVYAGHPDYREEWRP